jgi:hypothetical protein
MTGAPDNRSVIVASEAPSRIVPIHPLMFFPERGASALVRAHMHSLHRSPMNRFIHSGWHQAFTAGTRISRSLAMLVLAGVLSTGCDVHGTSGPGSLSTLVVAPNPQTLVVNASQQFTATGRDFSGAAVTVAPVWTVVAGGGSITSSGMFTAGSTPGTYATTVKATLDGITSSATVIVIAGPLASITIAPNPVTLSVGGTQQFTAVGKDAAGNVVPMTPSWSVVAGGGAISNAGVFTAGTTVGTFANTVQASSGGISATATVNVTAGALATITVSPNPMTLGVGVASPFTAVGRDANGNVVAITPTWSVVADGGTISALGMFTAGAVSGTFSNTVRATSGTISGTATVVVTAGPLASIVVTPNPASMTVGDTQQFTAVGRDAVGNVVPVTPVWSLAAGGGSVNGTGLFTAGTTPGTYTNTVRATSGSIAGSATVVVTAGALATITVTPNPASMDIGAAQQFTAVGRDASGNVVTILPAWSVVAGGGTIGATSGLFTAGNSSGTFGNTVRATSGTVSGFATVTVNAVTPPPPGQLTTITVTPNPATVQTNATQQFTAIGRDGNGNVVQISPVWSVTSLGGTIDANTGRFTAGSTTGTFTNTVRATSGTVSGSATVTVTANAPLPPTVNLGGAAANGIMAGTAVTCVSGGIINADVSISPGNTITGFGPCVITGVQNLNNGIAIQAQVDLTNAYNTLRDLPCPPANAIVANLGGTTKAAGVYCTASSIGVTGTLTLDGGGDPNATFVFQAGTSLITAGDIVLINGAQAKNVYWQVGSSATLGTASKWQGNILALTSITLVDNATLLGRALARNGAVSLGTNNVITLP